MTDAREQARRGATALLDTLDTLVGITRKLPESAWALPTGCPGWTVRDNVSHVVGLEAGFLGRKDPEVELPELPHVGDHNRFFEYSVQVRRSRTPREIAEELAEVTASRRDQLDAELANPDADLERAVMTPLGFEMTVAGVLGLRAFDITYHEHDISRAAGIPPRVTGPAIDAAVTRIMGNLARVLPTRVERLQGLSLSISLPDRDESWLLTFGEKPSARVGETGDVPVTLTLPTVQLFALTGGRGDASPELVTVGGDRELGSDIVGRLGMTP